MKKTVTRTLAIMLAFLLLVATMTACGQNATGTDPSPVTTEPAAGESTTAAPEKSTEATTAAAEESPAAPDTAKHVDLVVKVMGEAPQDISSIQAEINKFSEQDLNASVEFQYLTWADWENKYNLMLASGDAIDICYTANWTRFSQLAKSGAYLPLDDLLQYAPGIMQRMPKDNWDQVRINGKIYAVTNEFPEFTNEGLGYRDDLRKKYNLPEISSMDTMGQYFDAIKMNEKEILPAAPNFISLVWATQPYERMEGLEILGYKPGDTPDNFVFLPDQPFFKDHVALMKKWADAGYWSKSILSEKVSQTEMMGNGVVAATNHNMMQFKNIADRNKTTNPDWEINYFSWTDMTKIIHTAAAIQNGLALPQACGNPERAMMLIEKLHSDERYSLLTHYGIEGKHYNLTSDGFLNLDGIDSKAVGMAPDGMNAWGWRNSIYWKTIKGGWPIFDAKSAEMLKVTTPDPIWGYTFDPANVQAEQAALGSVRTQYGLPLLAGLVDDPEAATAEYIAKLKEAGLDKYMAEHKAQLQAWLASK